MSNPVAGTLTPAELKPLYRILLPATLLVLVSFIAARYSSNIVLADQLDNLHWTIAYCAAAWLAWRGVALADASTRDPRRWFAYGLTSSAIGQLCFDVQTLLAPDIFPDLSDLFFMALGPCCLWGILLTIRNHDRRLLEWSMIVDALTLSVVLLAMVLVLYLPHYPGAQKIVLAVMVTYPIAMLASSCITVVMLLTLRARLQLHWLGFAIASLLNGLLWMLWIYWQQNDSLNDHLWLYLLFSLVTLALGAGAMIWRVTVSTNPHWQRRCEQSLRLLPMLVAGTALTGVVVALLIPDLPHNTALAIYISAALVFVLTMIRQSLMLFDRERLLRIERESFSLHNDLQLLAKRLDIATRAAGIGVFEYQHRTDTMLWDQQMHALYGSDAQQFQGSISAWQDYVHPDDLNRLRLRFGELVHTKSVHSTTFRIIRADGQLRYIEAWAEFQHNESGAVERTVGVNWDITADHEAQANRQRLEAQLHQSHKLEAIGTLASGIAHDFNNLLGTILGNGELALQDLDVAHPAHTSLLEIRKAGRRARDLVQRIVTFGKPHDQQFKPSMLATVIEDTLDLVRATLPASVSIHGELDPDLPLVRLDNIQISQLLLNLCTNAYQAMPAQQGRIDIKLKLRDYRLSLPPLPHDLAPGRYLHLQVSDTGKGIDATIAEHIFKPFFTTKPAGEGSGLGLSIVQNVVRNHAGAIFIDSQPGNGTTFHIYLPVVTEVAAEREAIASGKPPAESVMNNGSGQHILYVDDETALVFLTTRMLERYGYRVTGCTDASVALQSVGATAFDLIITDHSMPIMSGMELSRAILRDHPEARIVLVSGYLPQREIERALALGIQRVILKPDTVDELVATVHQLLHSQAHDATQVVADIEQGYV